LFIIIRYYSFFFIIEIYNFAKNDKMEKILKKNEKFDENGNFMKNSKESIFVIFSFFQLNFNSFLQLNCS